MRRFTDRLLPIALALVIVWVQLATFGVVPSSRQRFENRALAPWPTTPRGADEVQSYPGAVNRFVDDHVGHRGWMIALNSWLRSGLFGGSTNDSVLRGDEGWMFMWRGDEPAEFVGRSRHDAATLRSIRIVLEERRDWLAERGIEFVFAIAPSKHHVYPQHLPAHAGEQAPGSKREQLLAYLGEASPDLRVVDTTPALVERSDETLYYKTDTHWNYRGGFIGYRGIMGEIGDIVPSTEWLVEDELEPHPMVRHTNLNKLLGLADTETVDQLRPPAGWTVKQRRPKAERWGKIMQKGTARVFQSSDPTTGRRAYFMADSFAGWNAEFVAQHFDRMALSNTWGPQWKHTEHFPASAIEREKPDVVIAQVVENRLNVGRGGSVIVSSGRPSNTPPVRTARLRRLWREHTGLAVRAEARAVGETEEGASTFELTLPVSTEKGWIAEIVLHADAPGWLGVVPADDLRPLKQARELLATKADRGDQTLYLCLPNAPDTTRLYHQQPGTTIRSIRVIPHPDLPPEPAAKRNAGTPAMG